MSRKNLLLLSIAAIALAGLFASGELLSVSINTTEASNDIQENVPPTPSFTDQERLSLLYPHTNVYLKDLDRLVYGNELNWPDMRYINEGAYLLGRTITPTEIRIVPAGDTVKGYNPVTEELTEAIEYIKQVIGNGFRPPTLEVVFIPPGGSLVMVHIDVEASSSDPDFSCGQDYEGPRGDSFRISYPDLGEHENAYQPEYGNIYSVAYTLGDFNSPFVDCLDDGWLYFYLPTLDVEPSLLWFEFIQTVNKTDVVTGENYSDTILSFWTPIDRPQ